jgi:hypothetical protein
MTQEDFDDNMAGIRKVRNQLLKDCDWTQLPDSNVDKQLWADYRQQLRDLPILYTVDGIENATFDFPIPPGG